MAAKFYRLTLSRIIIARDTLSATTDVNLGDGRLMSSRASLTAAMMDAAITSVDANLFVMRLLFYGVGSSHLAHHRTSGCYRRLASLCDKWPLKMSEKPELSQPWSPYPPGLL